MTTQKLLSIVIAAALAACTGRESAPPPPATPAAASSTVTVPVSATDLDTLIQRVVTEKGLVGLSIGVMQGGKVVLAKGYGFRSLDPREPVTPTTMFGIGSVTKQFTCSSALLLAEGGKLSMKDPVAKYVPTATRARDITLLDLGQHVSGYRDYYPLDFVSLEMLKPESADTVIGRYATRPLDFEPGSRWSYSNTNFLILGKAIEVASGKAVGAFMAERIFKPLGMTRTVFDASASDTGKALGYTSYALAAPSLAIPEATGWVGAAGAIWSTPTDLLTWDLALMDGKVLSPSSYAMLTTPRTLTDGRNTAYGCGLGVQTTGEAIVFQHGGAVAGTVAQNVVIPSTRSGVVVLANADFAATGEIIGTVVRQLTPRVDVPAVAGLPALEAAKTFLASVERGAVDRNTLGVDFNALLTPERIAADRASLVAHGKVSEVRVVRTRERGGMEVAIIQYKVGTTPAETAMYRTPDGKIQQFLINRR